MKHFLLLPVVRKADGEFETALLPTVSYFSSFNLYVEGKSEWQESCPFRPEMSPPECATMHSHR